MQLEPQLKPFTGEIYNYNTSNTMEDARVDISIGFWVCGQLAFSDIRVFNPVAKSYNAKYLKSIFATREKEEKKATIRIIETENGSFTPLVFVCTGGMSRECGLRVIQLRVGNKQNCHSNYYAPLIPA